MAETIFRALRMALALAIVAVATRPAGAVTILSQETVVYASTSMTPSATRIPERRTDQTTSVVRGNVSQSADLPLDLDLGGEARTTSSVEYGGDFLEVSLESFSSAELDARGHVLMELDEARALASAAVRLDFRVDEPTPYEWSLVGGGFHTEVYGVLTEETLGVVYSYSTIALRSPFYTLGDLLNDRGCVFDGECPGVDEVLPAGRYTLSLRAGSKDLVFIGEGTTGVIDNGGPAMLRFRLNAPVTVPEPTTALLFAIGLTALATKRRP